MVKGPVGMMFQNIPQNLIYITGSANRVVD
jgi:hypothetical protein